MENENVPEGAQNNDLVITEVSKAELLDEFNNLLDERDSALSQLVIKNADRKAAQEMVAGIEAAIFEKAREIRHGAKPLPLLDGPAAV